MPMNFGTSEPLGRIFTMFVSGWQFYFPFKGTHVYLEGGGRRRLTLNMGTSTKKSTFCCNLFIMTKEGVISDHGQVVIKPLGRFY